MPVDRPDAACQRRQRSNAASSGPDGVHAESYPSRAPSSTSPSSSASDSPWRGSMLKPIRMAVPLRISAGTGDAPGRPLSPGRGPAGPADTGEHDLVSVHHVPGAALDLRHDVLDDAPRHLGHEAAHGALDVLVVVAACLVPRFAVAQVDLVDKALPLEGVHRAEDGGEVGGGDLAAHGLEQVVEA